MEEQKALKIWGELWKLIKFSPITWVLSAIQTWYMWNVLLSQGFGVQKITLAQGFAVSVINSYLSVSVKPVKKSEEEPKAIETITLGLFKFSVFMVLTFIASLVL